MDDSLFDDLGAADALACEWIDRAVAWRRWAEPWAAQTRAATSLIVDAARVTAGARVLDLASGPGEPALTLARLVGPHGHVVATDVAPSMVAACREQAVGCRLTNMTCRVADAQDLPFACSSFDAVTCRFGIAHVPDYPRALAEVRRVLKVGGRAAFVAWGPRAQNPHFTLVDEALAAYPAPSPAGSRGPGPFTFATKGALHRVLLAAGFRHVDEEARQITLSWPGSVDDYWQGRREMSASTTALVGSLTVAERDRVGAAISARLRAYERDGRVDVPAVVIVAMGIA